MNTVFGLILIFCLISLPTHAEEGLPRFASLKSGEANLRVGPGTRYPIRWVYQRKSYPLEIVETYEHWRKVRDRDGEEGWLHKGLLSGRRTAVIEGEMRILRRRPDDNAPAALMAKPQVVGAVESCTREWCRLSIGSRSGWVRKNEIWGVYERETLSD